MTASKSPNRRKTNPLTLLRIFANASAKSPLSEVCEDGSKKVRNPPHIWEYLHLPTSYPSGLRQSRSTIFASPPAAADQTSICEDSEAQIQPLQNHIRGPNTLSTRYLGKFSTTSQIPRTPTRSRPASQPCGGQYSHRRSGCQAFFSRTIAARQKALRSPSTGYQAAMKGRYTCRFPSRYRARSRACRLMICARVHSRPR